MSNNAAEEPAPWPAPFTVRGQYAALEPLGPEHSQDLAQAVADGDLHRLWYTTIPSPQEMSAEIKRRQSEQAMGRMLPFAVIDARSGKAVGMSTYLNFDAAARRLEIGSTWYARSAQRTPINTECKLMLLTHAFEVLDSICVELRTHSMNFQSRRAIERLGAKLDGVLRSQTIMPNGTVRDTAAYSIIACEWPAVKANLEFKLGRSD